MFFQAGKVGPGQDFFFVGEVVFQMIAEFPALDQGFVAIFVAQTQGDGLQEVDKPAVLFVDNGMPRLERRSPLKPLFHSLIPAPARRAVPCAENPLF